MCAVLLAAVKFWKITRTLEFYTKVWPVSVFRWTWSNESKRSEV